jgi:hypothetical protein
MAVVVVAVPVLPALPAMAVVDVFALLSGQINFLHLPHKILMKQSLQPWAQALGQFQQV